MKRAYSLRRFCHSKVKAPADLRTILPPRFAHRMQRPGRHSACTFAQAENNRKRYFESSGDKTAIKWEKAKGA